MMSDSKQEFISLIANHARVQLGLSEDSQVYGCSDLSCLMMTGAPGDCPKCRKPLAMWSNIEIFNAIEHAFNVSYGKQN